MKDFYHDRVNLLLKCLPIVAKQACFALKGGTAINLFLRDDYPRASIDIDLTYIELRSRDETLVDIQTNLKIIKANIEEKLKGVKVKEEINKAMKIVFKLEVQDQEIAIKVEPNLILRGFVYQPRMLNVSQAVEDYYSLGAEKIPVMSYADTYAGKICAALDRQHPRDLFDVGFIIDNPLSPELKNAFLIYLISNNRPMYELLSPNLIDIKKVYIDEFAGMENIDTSIEQLLDNRINLIKRIKSSFDDKDKEFLLSVKKGEPDYSLFPLNNIADLPGIKWKLINIAKMDKAKHMEQLKKLERALV